MLGDLLNEANMVMMALEGLERILQVRPDPTAPSNPRPSPSLPLPSLSPSDLPSVACLFRSAGGGGGGASDDGREPLRGHAIIGQDRGARGTPIRRHRQEVATHCIEAGGGPIVERGSKEGPV